LIGILRKDLDDRTLDLQRERGIAECLQKQLDDRVASYLKSLLKEHHETITTKIAGQESKITDVIRVENENQKRYRL
jgi:hypothetical protein